MLTVTDMSSFAGHAGGIRCYLDKHEDLNFLRAFIRPFSKTAKVIFGDAEEVDLSGGLASPGMTLAGDLSDDGSGGGSSGNGSDEND